MGKIFIDATEATPAEMQEILKVAKEVANNLRRTVTVFTSTKIVEVEKDEKEEKEKVVKHPQEKFESW